MEKDRHLLRLKIEKKKKTKHTIKTSCGKHTQYKILFIKHQAVEKLMSFKDYGLKSGKGAYSFKDFS